MAMTTSVRSGEPLIHVSELYRFYHNGDNETFALRGVSLSVHAGEMVAVVGPSGSGKTTLLACIAGLDEPDGGHVNIAGNRITRRPEAVRTELRAKWLGVLLQSGNLLEHLTVLQNIKFAQNLVKGEHPDTSTLLAAAGLEDRAGAWPSTLSGGEAARAGLAVALANSPPILLADEPTGEVDAKNEVAILKIMRDRTEVGGAVVVVTHSERVAKEANRVIRLSYGRITDG
jgi:putative ABC transport system ATP-binding protein